MLSKQQISIQILKEKADALLTAHQTYFQAYRIPEKNDLCVSNIFSLDEQVQIASKPFESEFDWDFSAYAVFLVYLNLLYLGKLDLIDKSEAKRYFYYYAESDIFDFLSKEYFDVQAQELRQGEKFLR